MENNKTRINPSQQQRPNRPIHSITAALLLTATLTGCGPQLKNCSDAESKKMVLNAFFESAESVALSVLPGMFTGSSNAGRFLVARQAMEVQLNAIRTSAIDEKIGLTTCQAELKIIIPEETSDLIHDLDELRSLMQQEPDKPLPRINKNNVIVGPRTLSTTIDYTTQYTDDRKNIVGTIKGHKDLALVIGWIAHDIAFEFERSGKDARKEPKK